MQKRENRVKLLEFHGWELKSGSVKPHGESQGRLLEGEGDSHIAF